MMRGASGDECGNLLGQEYNRLARPECWKSPGKRLYLYLYLDQSLAVLPEGLRREQSVNAFKTVTIKLNFICIYNCESEVVEGWVLGTIHVAATTEFCVCGNHANRISTGRGGGADYREWDNEVVSRRGSGGKRRGSAIPHVVCVTECMCVKYLHGPEQIPYLILSWVYSTVWISSDTTLTSLCVIYFFCVTFIGRVSGSKCSQSMKIDNSSFERVEGFKYMGTSLTNQNSIQDEIKSRLKSGNACCHSVQNLLSSCLLSKNLKIKIYRTVILPFVLYGCET
jgi:hypothetical protein